ncbi:hypothetical protein LINPERHAP2_LOCUS12664 [Linum perenne]
MEATDTTTDKDTGERMTVLRRHRRKPTPHPTSSTLFRKVPNSQCYKWRNRMNPKQLELTRSYCLRDKLKKLRKVFKEALNDPSHERAPESQTTTQSTRPAYTNITNVVLSGGKANASKKGGPKSDILTDSNIGAS